MKNIITTLFFTCIMIFASCKTKTKEIIFNDSENPLGSEDTPKEVLHIEKTVIAKSGLRFRASPKGKVLDKFRYNARLTIVEKTGITEVITDNGNEISGEWVGVKHKDTVVYVFDAFLTDTKKPKSTTENPIDIAILQAYIIKPGQYHGDEIPDEMTILNWWGIFNENGNYTVKETPITITKVHDAVLDDETQKSGKKIVSNLSENCYLLMNNIAYLTERTIDTIATKPMVIHPEKPYKFNFHNHEYILSATAKSYDALNLNINYFNAEGYQLYLEKSENGTTTKQLLLFERYFDDQMIQILFIGDIDGDTIPDLLIDSSNHYNAYTPTLYLSKEAKEKEILKIVSLHTSVGS